ncbi:hypothetical protein Cri9333_3043 [Crinalium epipsammum PCC 9333]|uniref:Uncharacterized protein n=1 Tax=Crinalium epipsammum PCC 9333 TaxID=1173022 RepID=K9W298_9CYAN|nr:hypothetical protein [Crinalium epipsammum]AFZ13882.1 hypothetical protein Cri9333_3043 [Crinalium epipsammum PCC 9333]
MLEKIIIAITLTFSLNLFLGVKLDSKTPTSLAENLQVTTIETVNLLLAQK